MRDRKEKVFDYTDDAEQVVVQRLKDGTWFGFAEVDIEIPKQL